MNSFNSFFLRKKCTSAKWKQLKKCTSCHPKSLIWCENIVRTEENFAIISSLVLLKQLSFCNCFCILYCKISFLSNFSFTFDVWCFYFNSVAWWWCRLSWILNHISQNSFSQIACHSPNPELLKGFFTNLLILMYYVVSIEILCLCVINLSVTFPLICFWDIYDWT